jgi:hypothetical protein
VGKTRNSANGVKENSADLLVAGENPSRSHLGEASASIPVFKRELSYFCNNSQV